MKTLPSLQVAALGSAKVDSNISGLRTTETPVGLLRSNGAGFSIQNQSTEILYVKLGEGCTANDFHFSLPACTAAKDGTSNVLSVPYSGRVSVASVTLSYTFVGWK